MDATGLDDRAIARWRLAGQHLTGAGLDSTADVVDHLLAVQAENHDQAAWSLASRTGGATRAEIAAAFDDGAFLRTHVIRSTWHYATPADIGWLLELTWPRIWRSTYRTQVAALDITANDLDRAADTLVTAITSDGPLTRTEVSDRLADAGLPSTGQALSFQPSHAELHGLVCSGPLRDGDHTWALLADRAPDARRLDRDGALAELARRYLTGHGPATEHDLAYWATLTLGDVRAGIAAVADELESFEHDGRTYWYGAPPPDLDTPPEPRGHLLLLLDECYRGYQDSRMVLDADRIAPTGRQSALGIALVDGQLVGEMRRTVRTDEVEFALDGYRDLTGDEVAALRAAADDCGRFLDLDATVTGLGMP